MASGRKICQGAGIEKCSGNYGMHQEQDEGQAKYNKRQENIASGRKISQVAGKGNMFSESWRSC